MPSLSRSLKTTRSRLQETSEAAVERLSGPTGRRFKSQEVLQLLCSTSCWIEMYVIFVFVSAQQSKKSPVKPENTLKYK